MFLLYFSFLHSNKYPPDIDLCSLVFESIIHSKSEWIIQLCNIQFLKF